MNSKRFLASVLFVSALFLCGSVCAAPASDVRLPALFTDNMVLQREREIPVWGWANPGGEVSVSIAGNTATAEVGEDGKWRTNLPALPAGGPYEVKISGQESKALKNVLVGEVWICSGQSNMEMPVMVGNYGVKNGRKEISEANHPNIRLFTVPKITEATPQEDFEADGWVECSPETVPAFTAVGYFFGRHLHKQLGVPVGLIHSSWGGTVAEAWTSEVGLATIQDFRNVLPEVKGLVENYQSLQETREAKVREWVEALDDCDLGSDRESAPWAEPDLDASDWGSMDLPCIWEDAGLPDYDGYLWFRKEIEIPGSWRGKDLVLNLGPVNDWDRTFFNGRKVGGIEVPGKLVEKREYTIPADLVADGKNVIAVRVYDMGNKGGICGEKKELRLEVKGDPMSSISLAGAWRYKEGSNEKTRSAEPKIPFAASSIQNTPTVLFNAMIAPLVPYGIRGAIWYQGESNASRAYQYRTLFPTMILDWRRHWAQGDFPFLFVQLANFLPVDPKPVESDWAELREAQLHTLAFPKTGMACAIDIGEEKDIHPKNKQDVGKRLALAARHIAYGETDLVFSGPIYRFMEVETGKIRLHFDHVGGGLVAKDGNELTGFAIADKAGKFVWAEAEIDGDTVVVSSPKVPEPAAVRYGWANNPVCNLYNKEGLPASPFRTDSWPGIPVGEK